VLPFNRMLLKGGRRRTHALAQTQAEAQLYEQQHPVQLNTNKFIDKDWVIVVVPQSDDA